MRSSGEFYGGWRDYQRQLKGTEKRNSLFRKMPLLFAYSGGSLLILVLLFSVASWVSGTVSRGSQKGGPEQVKDPQAPAEARKKAPDPLPEKITRQNLPLLLQDFSCSESGLPARFQCSANGSNFTVFTSIDTSLQDYISNLLKRSGVVEAAAVVLNPEDGRVLAMVSHHSGGTSAGENLCLQAEFPAASLFKIVSAAAALEVAGYGPDQSVRFRGGLHTLYKSQIKAASGRYTTETSFRKAFARSINPVFGNLGAHKLGGKVLEEYSNRFLFNQTIPFEFPVSVSNMEVPEDSFGLAEVASGFNKRTVISPLHAALLSCAIANDGTVMAPWVVKEVCDDAGNVLYRGSPTPLVSPIGEKTAKNLRVLMHDTVLYGTCRRSFGIIRRKKNLRNVELGAKTGTINDKMDQFRVDWLTAYALPEKGKSAGICIAVLAVHGDKLGIKANQLARYVIDYRFKS